MKKLILLLLSLPNIVFGKEIDLKTTITDVTVFQAGAQVKRTGTTIIPAGESEIIVTDATSLLKKESIQVKADGDFIILSVHHEMKNEIVKYDENRITLLDQKETELIDKLEELIVAYNILIAEEKVIMNLSQVSTTTTGITVEQIVKAQELMHIKLTSIKNEKLKIARIINRNQEQLKLTKQELFALRSVKENVKPQIVIKVKSTKEIKGDFTINYIVPNARWFATYDLRVKTIDEPLTIEYKANVWQQTGEDWKNVNLKLSTGDPSQTSNKPKITTWWLALNQNYISPVAQSNYYKYTDHKITKVTGTVYDSKTGEPLPFCNIFVPGTSIGASTDFDGNFSLALPENATSIQVGYIGYASQTLAVNANHLRINLVENVQTLQEVTITAYDEPLIQKDNYSAVTITRQELKKSPNSRGSRSSSYVAPAAATQPTVTPQSNMINTEFVIEQKYSILSEAKNTSVQIKSIAAPVSYQYYCAPRYDKDVFLTALLVDWEQYNMLEGNANVFFEGTFVGNTLLDTKYLKDTLEISLGRDKNILVDRVKSKDYNKRQILGNDNISTRHWEITVRNNKKQKINLILEDQFPVTNDSRIEVKREEKSEGKLNDQTGIVTWTIELAGSESKKILFKYSVKYPKGTFIGLD